MSLGDGFRDSKGTDTQTPLELWPMI